MATPEQRHVWKERIRTESPEVLFPGTPRAFEVTPAEKIRYEANAAFGAVLVDDLVWLVSAEATVTEEELLKRQTMRAAALSTDEQRVRFEKCTKRLVELVRQTNTIGRKEILHRIQQYADVVTEGMSSFRFSHVSPEDIEVTSYGAVLVTIRDRHMWEDELEFLPTSSGLKVGTPQFEGTTTRQRDAFSRLIFLKAIGTEQEDSARPHELFHYLYRQVFVQEMTIRYATKTQRSTFSMLRNELIAYALSEEWQSGLRELLNRRDVGDDRLLRTKIKEEIAAELGTTSVSKEGLAQVDEYGFMLLQAQSEITRLFLKRSTAFKDWIGCALVAEDVKELVYHLAQIEPGPLDADALIPRNADGTLPLPMARKLGYLATNYLLKVQNVDRFINSIEYSLEQEQKKSDPDTKVIDSWNALLVQLKKFEKDIA